MGIPRRETPLTDDELRTWTERQQDGDAVDLPPGALPAGAAIVSRRATWNPESLSLVDDGTPPAKPEARLEVRRPMPETRIDIRPRVKEIRLSRLMTQKELAARSGVSVSAISRVESGLTNRMRIDSWHALANALEVGLEDLLELVEVPMTEEELREREERIARRKTKEAARQRARRQAAAKSREAQGAKEARQLAERRAAWEERQRQRAGAANDADPQSESPERPLPGDRMREG